MTSEINNTVNGSILNTDIFLDEVKDITAYEKALSTFSTYFYLSVKFVQFLLDVLALASDVYLIVIISKFQNLHNRINFFILQYAIFHLLYLVLASVILLLLELFGLRVYSNNSVYIIINLDHLTLTLSFYALLFMAVDWCITNCYPNVYDRYPKLFKYGVYIMYSLAIPPWIVSSTVSFVKGWDGSDIRLYFELASFISCVIIIITVTKLKRRKILSAEAYKTEYALTIPRMVLFYSFFMFVIRLIVMCVENLLPETYLEILFTFYYIGESILLVIPAIILYQLIKLNKNFNAAYLKCCKKKRIENYDDDSNLDKDSVNEDPVNNVIYDRSHEIDGHTTDSLEAKKRKYQEIEKQLPKNNILCNTT